MKVKVGLEPREDAARVRAVRDAIGPEIKLGVDANGGWSVAQAVAVLDALRDQGLAFAEQPVPPGDPLQLADVRRRVGLPVVADESVNNAQDALNLIRAGAVDALSIYVGKAGGIGPARAIAAVAAAAGVACTVGSNLELGIGSAAMIHLALATPGIEAEAWPCDILTPFYNEHDLLTESLPITAGQARAFERPGLGVELDEAALARYRA